VKARAAAVLLALATVLAGCGGGDDGEAGSEQALRCPGLEWEGNEYLSNDDVRLPAERGEELGEATIPACGPRQERQVAVARIPGVDPSVALATPEDVFRVWIAETARAQDYPDALERILFGLSCDEAGPFTLAGRLVGISPPGEPLFVQLDVDRTDAAGRAYRGVALDLTVRASTDGLNSRGALAKLALGVARLRASVRCVEAERPNRTFLAESLARG
jgi:hypothetical protein